MNKMMKYKTMLFAVLLVISFQGCSKLITGVGTYTGYGFDGTVYELDNADFRVFKKKVNVEYPVKFDKSKAYIYNDSAKAILEDVNGTVVLDYYSNPSDDFIKEVEEGKYTFVGFGACGDYSITINARKGYIYAFRHGATSRPFWTYCRGPQEIFKKDNFYKSQKQISSPGYEIDEDNRGKIDEIIASSFYQSDYDDFKDDFKDVNVSERKAYMDWDEGIPIE